MTAPAFPGVATNWLDQYTQVAAGGAVVPQRPVLNLLGSGVVIADNAANGSTDVTFTGGVSGNTTQYDVTPSPTSGNVVLVFPAGQQYANIVGLTGDITIIGIQDSTPIPSGQTLTRAVTNGSIGHNVSFAFLNAGTTAANQIDSGRPGGASQAPVTLAPQAGEAILQRNSTTSKWRLMSAGWAYPKEVNILDFGADPTGVTTCDVQIQNAINAAGSRPVYFPPGTYLCSNPLVVNTSYTKIYGADGTSFSTCTIKNTNACDAFYIAPVFAAKVHCEVVSGVTYAHFYGTTGSPPAGAARAPYINFRDRYVGNLHGLSSFTFECSVIVNSIGGGGRVVVSAGSETNNSTQTSAFGITLNGVGPYSVAANLTTTGGSVSIGGGAINDTNPHAIAASYSSVDGFLRLYLDGVFIGHVAATGTVVQPWWENFMLGQYFGTYPEANQIAGFGDCLVGNIRISNVARYRSEAGGTTYTPPLSANLGRDSNNVLLMLFDTANHFASDQIIKAVSDIPYGNTGAYAYYHWRGVGNIAVDGISSVTIENLSINSAIGGCISCEVFTRGLFSRLYLQGVCGITKTNNCFYGYIRDIIPAIGLPQGVAAYGGWRSWGVGLLNTSGLHSIRDVVAGGTTGWGLVLSNSGGTRLDQVSVNTVAGVGGIYADGNAYVWHTVSVGDEASVLGFSGNLVVLNGVQGLKVEASSFVVTTNNSPAVLIDGGNNIKIAADFSINGPVCTTFVAPSTDLVDLDGSTQFTTLGSTYLPISRALTKQWGDGTGPLMHSRQESGGASFVDFASDANLTLSVNDLLGGGVLTFTDSHAVLTTGRTVILPLCAGLSEGYVRRARNRTAQTLTLRGAVGNTIGITAGSTTTIMGVMQPATGTVTPNAGLQTVVGVGTLFTTELQVGSIVYFAADPGFARRYAVATITDNTHLTVSVPISGSSTSGQQLWIQNWVTV